MSCKLWLQCGHVNSQSEHSDFNVTTKFSIDSFSDCVSDVNFKWCTAGFECWVTMVSRVVRS